MMVKMARQIHYTWKASDENFSKWKDPHREITKYLVAADIVWLLKSKGCHADHPHTQMQAKICHIKGIMRQAYDFINSETREGVKSSELFKSFHEKVIFWIDCRSHLKTFRLTFLFILLCNVRFSIFVLISTT